MEEAAPNDQWLFSDAELEQTPSILDGMLLDTEKAYRHKTVLFIIEMGKKLEPYVLLRSI